MTDATKTPSSNAFFWLMVGLEVVAIPFFALLLFFVLTIERPSAEEKFSIALLAAYPFLIAFVGFYGRSLLKQNRRTDAHLLALGPLLAIAIFLIYFAGV